MLAMVFAVAAGACSDTSADTTTSTTTTSTTTTTTPAPAPVDRLVVLGVDGNVFTVAADGSDEIALSDDAGDSVTHFQPVWSPDATRVAFGTVDGTSFGITVAAGDGSAADTYATATFPFYYHWDSQGNRVGLLRNAEAGGIVMEVVEDGGVSLLDTGAPFYFSWEPGGTRLVWHIGRDRLEIRENDAGLTPVADQPGTFQAPQWTESGVFYAIGDGDMQTLVMSDGSGGDPAPVGRIRGFALFSATRDGSRVAVQGRTEAPDAVAALQGQVPQVPFNQVAVIDVAAGTIERVTDDPALAFFWDPSGESLLTLGTGSQPATLTWSVWRDGAATELATFTPSPTFLRDYLPFFDQYAQSMTLWSPDGTRFAFPGVVDGERGIWVQAIDGTPPARVADGLFVGWSPV
jgi:TolB protein